MKKKLLFAASILFAASSTVSASHAKCCLPDLEVIPYAGADAQWRHTGFKKNLGKNTFKTDYGQANIYGGVQLTEFFGLEVGYEMTNSSNKNSTYSRGTVVLNNPAQTNVNVIGKAKFTGWHGSVVGYLPLGYIPCFPECWRLSLVGTIGFTTIRTRLSPYFTVLSTPGVAAPVGATTPFVFTKTKTVLRAGGGIRHFITDCAGFRIMAFWEDTHQLKSVRPITPDAIQIFREFAKLKGSVTVGAGLFFLF